MRLQSSLRWSVALATTAIVWSVAAAADTANGEKSLNDVGITARIETIYLLSGDLNPFKINTSTTDGVVTLTGVVREQVDKDLAGRLAKTVNGVKKVDNELTVKRDVEVYQENSKWRQDVDDAALNARIRRRLAYNSSVKSAALDITVDGAKVTVAGETDSAAKKAEIERIIGDTTGVNRVDSKIVVVEKKVPADAKPAAPGSQETITETLTDEWVEKMVEASVAWNRNLTIRDVHVEVDKGVCTLTGSVATPGQKELAGSIAKSTDGVKSVVNKIEVSSNA